MEHSGSLLVVVVDVNSSSWELLPEACGSFSDLLQSVYLLCNGHKMLDRKNDTCIITMGSNSTAFVGSGGSVSGCEQVLKEFTAVSRTAGSRHCALARCLSQAMCGE